MCVLEGVKEGRWGIWDGAGNGRNGERGIEEKERKAYCRGFQPLNHTFTTDLKAIFFPVSP